MLTCIEPGNGEHVSLQVETHFTCASCKVCVYNICKIKVGEKKEEVKMLHMKCYKQNVLVASNISSLEDAANIEK